MALCLIRSPAAMRAWTANMRQAECRIAFVPTMGYLHEGHLALLRAARKRGDRLVLSIFVNPLQFGPTEDFARYPRDEASDLDKAGSVGTDAAYLPDAKAMYPDGFQTTVRITELEKGLCGERRPGHFAGVATVVLKLFNQVQPHVAVFGQKDYQQLQVIRRMVQDLDLGIEVVGLPIVREADGLAMSSRNAYLSRDERLRAASINQGLCEARRLYDAGQRSAQVLIAVVRSTIEAARLRVDYIELRHVDSLQTCATADEPAVLVVAAFAGNTRLIDNQLLCPSNSP